MKSIFQPIGLSIYDLASLNLPSVHLLVAYGIMGTCFPQIFSEKATTIGATRDGPG
jgi:hypothetical protein